MNILYILLGTGLLIWVGTLSYRGNVPEIKQRIDDKPLTIGLFSLLVGIAAMIVGVLSINIGVLSIFGLFN